MTPEEILAIVTGLATAIPQLAGLLAGLKSGTSASAADVLAILSKCGVDRAIWATNIAAAEAKGN